MEREGVHLGANVVYLTMDFFFLRFICLSERERVSTQAGVGEGRGRSRLPADQGA